MQYFIHDEYVTLKQLQDTNHKYPGQQEKRYKNLDLLKEKVKDGAKSATSNTIRDNAIKVRKIKRSEMKDRILVRRMYTRDRWISICPDYGLLIEDRPCPYAHGDLPIHTLIDHEVPNQILGIGEIDPIRTLSLANNQLINKRFDNVNKIIDPPFQARVGALKHRHTWKMLPNYVWTVDQIGDVQQLNVPDVTGSTYIETRNDIKDAVSRALGRFDVLTRNESANNKTATEVKAAFTEQNARNKQKQNNVDMFVQRLATQMLQLNQQYLTKSKLIRIVGKEALSSFNNEDSLKEYQPKIDPVNDVPILSDDNTPILEKQIKKTMYKGKEVPKFTMSNKDYGFLVVDPDDIRGSYDYIVESGSTSLPDPSAEVENLGMAIKIIRENMDLLGQDSKSINITPIIEKLLTSLNVKNVDQIIQNIDQTQMLGQQMPQQQMMMQGQQPIIQ
jgi:hypothetical protein